MCGNDNDGILAGTRICMVVYSYYPMDQRVRREAEVLKENGAAVHVICLRNENETRFEVHNEIMIYRVPQQIRRKGKYLLYFLRYFIFLFFSSVLLTRLFIRNRYNAVHVNSIPDYEVFCAIVPKLFGAKIILDLHELTPEVFATKFNITLDSKRVDIAKFIEKVSVRFADLVITTNYLHRSIIMERTKKKEVTIVMNLPKRDIFRSRDMADFIEENNLTGSFIVSYVGGLNPERELDVVLKAIKYSKKRIPNIILILCGTGERDYISFLNNLIAKLNLEKNVLYLEFIPLDDILNYSKISNVTLCPYKSNPNLDVALSTKVFEYLLIPKPVIVAELSLMSKEFKDLVLFYKSSDYKSLGYKIIEIYENEDVFKEMANKAQKILFEKYNPEKNEKNLVKLYINLIT